MVAPETNDEKTRSIPDLLRLLASDITGLFRSEARLARAEVSELAGQVATGLELIGAGAILLLVALIVLVQALIIPLAGWIGAGWAALIVGGVLALIGAIMVIRGRSDLKGANLVPRRTLEQPERDARLVKEHV